MAVYNELQVGRYVRFFQKFLSIKGRQPAPLTFSGEIGAFWPLMHGVENRYLEAWFRYGFSFVAPAVAAQVTDVMIRNPAGSNVIAVIEKLVLREAANDNFLIGVQPQAADFASSQNVAGSRLDPRGPNAPTLHVSSTNNIAATLANMNIGVIANTDREVILTDDQEITLLPGDAMVLVNSVVNNQFAVSWLWRERALEESEFK